MKLSQLSVLPLRKPSLLRAILLPLAALAVSMRLAGFPDLSALHRSPWQALLVPFGCLGVVDAFRCLQRRWSLYHAGILILLYANLITLATIVFLWLCS